jgi:hypothetical protein
MHLVTPRLVTAMASVCAIGASAQSTFLRTYGSDTVSDYGHSVVRSIDDGFYIGGLEVEADSTFAYVGHGVVWRVNADGDEVWRREYAVPGTETLEFDHMIATADGDLLATGLLDQGIGPGELDAYIAKLDTAGNVLWSVTVGGASDQRVYQTKGTPDGGCISAGWNSITNAVNDAGAYLIRCDSMGDTLWTRTYPNPYPWDQYAHTVAVMPDLGYVLAGKRYYGNASYVHLIRTNEYGDTLWTRTLDTLEQGEGRDLVITDAGHIMLTGYSTATGFSNPFLAELDTDGHVLWVRIYDEAVSGWGYSLCSTSSGYALFGQDYLYDFLLINTALDGELNWMRTFDEALDYGSSVIQDSDGGFTMAGTTTYGGLLALDAVLIRTDSLGDISTDIWQFATAHSGTQLFPNPTNGTLHLTSSVPVNSVCMVLNAMGQVVQRSVFDGRSLDVSMLNPGLYFLELTVGGRAQHLPFIKA